MFRKHKVSLKIITMAGVLMVALIGGYNAAVGVAAQVYDDWQAPPSAAKDPNPIPATPASINDGQAVFSQNCTACHGDDGQGDGPTGAFLSPHPANLTMASVWKQGEGVIFWKITNGRSPMPSFQDSLSDKQRWDVINYMHQKFDPDAAGK